MLSLSQITTITGARENARSTYSSLNRSALLRSGYQLCWRPVSGVVPVCFPGAVVPGVPGCAPAPTAPAMPPFASLGWFVLVMRVLAGRTAAASR